MKFRIAVPIAALALGLTVAGCGAATTSSGTTAAAGSSSSAGPTTAGSAKAGVVLNDADVTFLTDMLPHHAQALQMATMVGGRSTNQAIIDLATKINDEQQPEIDTMTSLLTSFGKPVPSTTSSMGGMSMSATSWMVGMMSADDMTKLGTLSGSQFDKTWLTMMTAHHTGAVDMANVELKSGSNADAKKLATNIIAAQNTEIATMKALLAAV